MSDVYIITVGSSLFQSATWEGEAFEKFAKEHDFCIEYQAFLKTEDEDDPNKDGPLFVPEKRKEMSKKVKPILEEFLLEGNATEWKDYIADYNPGNPKYDKRYSAEITTLLTLARMNDKIQTPGELLNSHPVYLICDDSTEEGSTRHVAAHLKQVLIKLCGDAVTPDIYIEPIPEFSSTVRGELRMGLDDFKNKLTRWAVIDHPDANKHIIVTGGFKVYAMIASELLMDKVNILYQHEDADLVFIHEFEKGKRNMRIGGIDD